MAHTHPRAVTGGPWFGVDVVDLRNPRTRGRHLDERFMERIFGDRERALVGDSADPERAVWRHWAAKEAAFKAVGMRTHPGLPPPFAHARFEVVDIGFESAEVVWQEERIAIVFDETVPDRRVAAVGCVGELDDAVRWTARDTEETAVRLGVLEARALDQRLRPAEARAARGFTHGLVRLAARTEIATRCGLAPERLEIVTPRGPTGRVPPEVHLDGALYPDARVSLSHDGALVAWAIWVAPDRPVV